MSEGRPEQSQPDLCIETPTAGQQGVCVVPDNPDTGHICAVACFDAPAGYGIWATVNNSPPGGIPPDSRVGPKCRWNDLPGAYYDGAWSFLKIRAQVNLAGDEVSQINEFAGRPCWQTDCDQESVTGPAVGTSPAQRHPASRVTAGQGHLSLTTRLWHLTAAGFSRPELDGYNGTYLLEMRHVDIQRDCLWESRPTGRGKPVVQLRCEFPLPITYRLTFQIKGYPPIEYTRCAREWNPQGANKLYLNARTVPDGETAPPNLIVKPA